MKVLYDARAAAYTQRPRALHSLVSSKVMVIAVNFLVKLHTFGLWEVHKVM